jgi:hypothetical protein
MAQRDGAPWRLSHYPAASRSVVGLTKHQQMPPDSGGTHHIVTIRNPAKHANPKSAHQAAISTRSAIECAEF